MPRYFLILVLLLAACLAAAPAYAGCSNPTGNEADRIYNSDYQTLQFCNGTNWVPFGAYNAYVGPGDIVSGATAWYGLRAYSAAVAATGTQKAINIRRASDNTTKDILIRKSGNLDTPTAATFCASTTCYVTKWYDQSGGGHDMTQATASNQPELILSALNGLPGILGISANSTELSITGPSLVYSYPQTMAVVVERTGNFTGGVILNTNNTGGGPILSFDTANNVNIYATQQFDGTATDSVAHSVIGLFNGSSSGIVVDGTSANSGTLTNANTQSVWRTFGGSGQNYLQGYIFEVGLWPSLAFSSTQQTSMCHNQYAYWGTSTAC